MAISQTVYVNIVVRGGTGVAKLADPTEPVKKGMQETDKAGQFLLRTIFTLQKALISMVGVMIAWTALITIPEAVISGIAKALAAVVKFGEEVNKTVLSIAGLLASYASFGDTVEESFNNATKASFNLQLVFAELAAKSLATAQDIQRGFQIFVARGGLEFVGGDLRKAAELTAFLVNLNIALNGEYQKERQIVTEISAFLEGQARAGAMIARMIKAQVGDLNSYLAARKKEGNLLEDLERRFGGINRAAEKLGETLTGIVTSIAGTAMIVNSMAFQNGAFPLIASILKQWRTLLVSVAIELGTIKSETQALSPAAEALLRAFAYINFALEFTALTLAKLINLKAGDALASSIEVIARAIVTAVVVIDTAITALVELVKEKLGTFISGWLFKAIMPSAAIEARVDQIMTNIKKKLAEGGGLDLLKKLFGTGAVSPEVEKAIERIQDFIQKTDDQIKIMAAGENQVLIAEIKRAAIIRDQEKNLKLVSPELAKQARAINDIALNLEKIEAQRKADIKLANEAFETSSKGVQQLIKTLDTLEEWVIKYQDIVQQGISFNATQADIDAMIKKANDDFSDQAEILRKVLGYIHEIDVIAQYNRGFHQYISDVQDVTDRTHTLISSLREAEIRYRAGEIGFKELADALELVKLQVAENDYVIMGLNLAIGAASKDEIPALESALRALTAANRQGTSAIIATGNALSITGALMDRMGSSMEQFLRKQKSGWATLIDVLQGAAAMIGEGMGNAFTQMFQAIMSGESAMGAFKAFLGQILIQVGNLAVSLGTISLLGSLIPALAPLFNPGAAIALIAAGAAAIALGVAMGGAGGRSAGASEAASSTSGPSSASYSASQKDIAVQQGMMIALDNNTRAVTALNGEISRLSKEKGDVLVSNVVRKNPGVVIAPLKSKLTGSFDSAMGLGSALLQQS